MTTASSLTRSNLLEESSDDDSDLERELEMPPTFSQQSQPTVSQENASQPSEDENEPSSPTPTMTEEEIEAQAQHKVKLMPLAIAQDITSPSELFWHRESKKKSPYPVRFVQQISDKVLVQHVGTPHKYQQAYAKQTQLTPYNGNSEQRAWCPETTKQYVKALKNRRSKGKVQYSTVYLRAEELYLERLLNIVIENEVKAREEEQKQEQEELREQECSNAAVRPRKKRQDWVIASEHGAPDKGEPLRAGDVIEYTLPHFVSGRREGYRVSTILSIQKDEYPLTLKNDDRLPRTDCIRRIHRLVRGELVEYNGESKPIQDHKLKYDKNNVTRGAGISEEAQRVEAIIEKNFAKHQSALEATGIPLDSLQNVGQRNKRKEENAEDGMEEADCKMPASDTVGGENRKERDEENETPSHENKKRAKRTVESSPK